VDVAQRNKAGRFGQAQALLVVKLCASLAVGNGDGEDRSGHALEKDRSRLLDPDQGRAPLETLRAIAYEARPMLGAGNQFLQGREHLTTIADAKCERRLAREEVLEFAP